MVWNYSPPLNLQYSQGMSDIGAIINFQFGAITLVRFFEVWRSSYQWNATAELWFLQSSSIQEFYTLDNHDLNRWANITKKPPVWRTPRGVLNKSMYLSEISGLGKQKKKVTNASLFTISSYNVFLLKKLFTHFKFDNFTLHYTLYLLFTWTH